MRRAITSAALSACLAASSAAGAEDMRSTAGLEVRNDPQSMGVPLAGIVFDGGSKEQRITGRGVLRVGNFALDLSLSGASVDKATQRSALWSSAARGAGGSVSLGITWSNFSIRNYASVFDQLEQTLCPQQEKLNAARAQAALAEDDEYKAAVALAEKRVELKQKAEALAKQKRAEAIEARARADKLASAKEAGNLELARLAASHAEAFADLAAERAAEAAVAAETAQKAAKKEEARVTKPFKRVCSNDRLDPSLERRINWPFKPAFITRIQGAVESKSTDYLDAGDGTKKTDVVHPWNVSLGVGVFFTQNTLVAASMGYRRARSASDGVSVCQNQTIGGATKNPPVYTCEDLVVGAPGWKQTTTLRAELRQYLAANVSTNPWFSYTWSGTEMGLFAPRQGAWQFEIPVYVQVPTFAARKDEKPGEKKEESPAFIAGVAFTHKQTWGLGDKNENSDTFSVFLGGSFDMGSF